MHEQGWIHRDVKPENILVNKSGDVRVIDYALAMRPFSIFKKMVGGEGAAARDAQLHVARADPVRAAAPSADIYSFGVTCYEIACGRPPFRANSQNDLLNKHISDRPVPPTAHNAAITAEFSDLVLKMLQKKPADRLAEPRGLPPGILAGADLQGRSRPDDGAGPSARAPSGLSVPGT